MLLLRERERESSRCLPGLRGLAAFLICFFLPAHNAFAQELADATVTVDKTTITQGESAEIVFEKEGTDAAGLRLELEPQSVPADIFLGRGRGAGHTTNVPRGKIRFRVTIRTFSNEDTPTRNFAELEPQGIDEDTSFSVKISGPGFSGEPTINFKHLDAEGSLIKESTEITLHFIICPGCEPSAPIKLRLRVYLEGALR